MTAPPQLAVTVQAEDFEVSALQRELLGGAQEEGAVACFTGYVRGANASGSLQCMELEHYPGMTERSIEGILARAATRWPLLAAKVVHRIGRLRPGDQIVWVGVASAHRDAAFSACEFIMDYLKNEAPFWKKETGSQGAAQWVDVRTDDRVRAARWDDDKPA
ncbi:MAG: molybdenum cofactor biosynthesis protein MoaE [Pseudomonadales bacterium]|nr:molybdenum cofactor biosynthesis protein MoaE [Halioglobus sp.]MCP5131803.1 molybdenum cofactor biosynthesis protein MoaE [Pseudomonadales bacterium]